MNKEGEVRQMSMKGNQVKFIEKHSATIKILEHCVGSIIGWEIGKMIISALTNCF